MDFVDIRKPHLKGKARRKIVVRLPWEAGGGLEILLRSLYGTRDAAACWDACIGEVVKQLRCAQGPCPCLFRRGGGESFVVFVHGDDFVTVGSLGQCRWLRECLKIEWEFEERGALAVEV